MGISERFKNKIKSTAVISGVQIEDDDLKLELMLKIQNTPVWEDFSSDEKKALISAFVNNKISNSSDKERNLIIENFQKSLIA